MAGGTPSSRPVGMDGILRKLAEHDRRINALAGTNGLESAVIGSGGVTVREGRIIAEDGSVIARNMTTNGMVAISNAATFYYPEWTPEEGGDRFGYVQINQGEDANNNLWIRPPQDPGTSGSPTRLTLRGPGGGFTGQAWLYSDGDINFVADGRVYLGGERIDIVSGDLRLYSLQTTSSAANLRLDTTGGIPVVKLVSSSARYKTDPAEAVVDPAEVLSLSGRTWVDKQKLETSPEGDVRRDVGFIAEELDERPSLRQFVEYDDQGRPDTIQYDRLSVALLEVAKGQETRLADQQAQIDALSARLDAVEGA